MRDRNLGRHDMLTLVVAVHWFLSRQTPLRSMSVKSAGAFLSEGRVGAIPRPGAAVAFLMLQNHQRIASIFFQGLDLRGRCS